MQAEYAPLTRYDIKARAIACGYRFAVAIREDRTMVQWGDRLEYDLGIWNDFPTGIKVRYVECGDSFAVAIKQDGTMVQWGDRDARTGFPEGVKVKSVSCGVRHSVAIKEDGAIIQWGNDRARNGYPGDIKVKSIACQGHRTFAVKEDGTVIGWGDAEGLERVLQKFPPELKAKRVRASKDYSFVIAVKEPGGYRVSLEPHAPRLRDIPLGTVQTIVPGYSHAVFLKQDGTMLPWGDDGTRSRPSIPVQKLACANLHLVGIDMDGYIVEWGKVWNSTPTDTKPAVPMPPVSTAEGPVELLASMTSATPTPNPHSDLLTPLTPAIPKTSMTYTPATTAFDAVMQTDVPLDEALADPDKPLIVKVGSTYSLVDGSYLRNGIKDGSLLRYACTHDTGLAVFANNVYGKNPFVYIKGLQSGNFLVLLSSLKSVLEQNVQTIELTPTTSVFPHIAAMHSVIKTGSKNFFGQEVDLVGADHCQAGSQQTLYSIQELVLKKQSGSKRKTRKRRSGKIPKKTRRNRRR